MSRTIGRKTLWMGEYIKVEEITYLDHRGRTQSWEAVGRTHRGGVVVVLPITRNEEVVLIRQYRPALERYVIELPAGLVEEGEDLEEAARRELLEETGYHAGDMEMLTEGVMSTGMNTELWRIFVARGCLPATPEVIARNPGDENEDIEALSFPIASLKEDLEAARRDGEILDIKILGFLHLALQE